jgi:hypothetical protein
MKSNLVIAAGLGLGFVGSVAMADVFYRNEIQGNLIEGDMELDSFSEVASWDGPEYDWGFTEGNTADIDIRQISIRFNFDLLDGFEINFTDDEFYGWVFTDVNDTMADFVSVSMSGQSSNGVDWSTVDAQVLNADQFYVDFGTMAADESIVDGDFARVTMSYIPAPAGVLGLAGLCFGAGARRRRG